MTEPKTATGDDTQGNIVIPDEVKEKFPDLIPQILQSKSMDDEERNYWFSVLPIMTDEQVNELRDILKSEQDREKKEQKIADVDTKKIDEEKRKKREERQKKEEMARKKDEEIAEELLEELGI